MDQSTQDLIRAIAPAVSATVAVLTLLGTWLKVRTKLRGKCMFSKYYENPQFSQTSYAATGAISRYIASDDSRFESYRNTIESLKKYSELQYAQTVGVLEMRNLGKKRLSNVEVHFPYVFMVRVKRDGYPNREEITKSTDCFIVRVEDMSYRDSFKMEFWSRGEPERFLEELKVVHGEGSGHVTFYVPAPAVFRILTDRGFYLISGALLLIVTVVAIVTFMVARLTS
jgi:hypothetical protein